MSAARFDESYLKELMEKRKQWAAGGVRAGHRGEFNLKTGGIANTSTAVKRIRQGKKKAREQSTGAANNDIAVSGRYLDVLRQGINTTGLPRWLIDIIQNDDDIAMALTTKGFTPDSPHKQALITIAKDITMLIGRKKTDKEKGRRANHEHYIQVRIFYLLERDYPEIYYFVKAVPNGGLRADSVGFEMLSEGQKKGSPDIDVEIPRGRYHGMKLEVKSENGVLSDKQREQLERLNAIGYYSVCRKGFDQCWLALMNYFALPSFDNKTTIPCDEGSI